MVVMCLCIPTCAPAQPSIQRGKSTRGSPRLAASRVSLSSWAPLISLLSLSSFPLVHRLLFLPLLLLSASIPLSVSLPLWRLLSCDTRDGWMINGQVSGVIRGWCGRKFRARPWIASLIAGLSLPHTLLAASCKTGAARVFCLCRHTH